MTEGGGKAIVLRLVWYDTELSQNGRIKNYLVSCIDIPHRYVMLPQNTLQRVSESAPIPVKLDTYSPFPLRIITHWKKTTYSYVQANHILARPV